MIGQPKANVHADQSSDRFSDVFKARAARKKENLSLTSADADKKYVEFKCHLNPDGASLPIQTRWMMKLPPTFSTVVANFTADRKFQFARRRLITPTRSVLLRPIKPSRQKILLGRQDSSITAFHLESVGWTAVD
jgi:hypothetical protein